MSLANPSELLVLFTRYPEPGKTKTRLIPALGPVNAAELQRRMTEHVLNRICGLNLSRQVELEVHYEGGNRALMEKWLGPDLSYRSQGRGNVGARMARTFNKAFDRGVDRVVIVGSDCPGITEATAGTSFDLLKQFDLVLGPANDGGYYLIGLRQEEPELFKDIPWGTAEVRARTLKIADQLGLRWIEVEPLSDVDRIEDIGIWESEATSREDPPQPAISIIIPTLNEAENLPATLTSIKGKVDLEIIVVDGGSSDKTPELANSLGVRLLTTTANRARQINAGGLAARSEVLLFLHGDTRLPSGFDQFAQDLLAKPKTIAGAFTLGIDGPEIGLRLIEKLANFRSRFFQMPYGDQAIFLKTNVFRSIGGFPEIPIMEDFVFMQRVRKEGKVVIAPVAVSTSSRRWKKLGILKTTLINQVVLLAYFLGSDLKRLARWYRKATLRN
ncbi:MAG: TIGR04283 family arsenosugar biosynthesis glycosyltransferase [Syntrophobacterales bacterium]